MFGGFGFCLKIQEYNSALLLYQNKITNIAPENTKYYSNLNRLHSAILLKRFSNLLWTWVISKNNCEFVDLDQVKSQEEKQDIIDSCKLWIFKWTNNKFFPYWYITKWELVITLARILTHSWSYELEQSYDYLLLNKIITIDDRQFSNTKIYRTDFYMMLARVLKIKWYVIKQLPKVCAYEWEEVSDVLTGYQTKCCNWLTMSFDNFKIDNWICQNFVQTGSVVGVCIECWDWICLWKENICNCPKDCWK